jgi:hypothetical protein
MPEDKRPNRVRIGFDTSLVRTQAGFRKALKEFKEYHGLTSEYFKEKYYGNYPKKISFVSNI